MMKKILILFILTYISFGCNKNALDPIVEDDITGGTLNVTVKDERILPIKVEASIAGKNDYMEIGQINSMGETIEVHLFPKQYDFKFTTLTTTPSFSGKIKEDMGRQITGGQTFSEELDTTYDFIEDPGTLSVNVLNAKLLPVKVEASIVGKNDYKEIGNVTKANEVLNIDVAPNRYDFKFTTLTQLESLKGKVKEDMDRQIMGAQTISRELDVGVDFEEDTGTLLVRLYKNKIFDSFKIYKLDATTYEYIDEIIRPFYDDYAEKEMQLPVGEHTFKFEVPIGSLDFPWGAEGTTKLKIEKNGITTITEFQFIDSGRYFIKVGSTYKSKCNVTMINPITVHVGRINPITGTYEEIKAPNLYQDSDTSYPKILWFNGLHFPPGEYDIKLKIEMVDGNCYHYDMYDGYEYVKKNIVIRNIADNGYIDIKASDFTPPQP